MDNLSPIALFTEVVNAGVPYALTWIIGKYVVNTLISWVTGKDYML